MADFWHFISAVVAHSVGLLAGCVMTVAMQLYEKYAKSTVSRPIYSLILGSLVFFACYQVWLEDHTSLLGRVADVHRLEGANTELTRDRDDWKNKATASEQRIIPPSPKSNSKFEDIRRLKEEAIHLENELSVFLQERTESAKSQGLEGVPGLSMQNSFYFGSVNDFTAETWALFDQRYSKRVGLYAGDIVRYSLNRESKSIEDTLQAARSKKAINGEQVNGIRTTITQAGNRL